MNLFNTGPLGLAGKRVPLRALLANSTFRLVMRISFLNMALLIGSLKLLSASPAVGQDLQNIRVTLDISHAPLSQVFKRIESQTELIFVYPREVNKYSEVTLARGTYSVKEALEKALDGTELGYSRKNNYVVISEAEEAKGHEVEENRDAAVMAVERRIVYGKIIDPTSEPIPGVNILVQGTTRGTTSDTDGKYSIDVQSGETLVFSFIGFKALTAEVGERTVIDVTLEADAAMLSEVTVSGGYYETTDKLKTGSIVKVTAKDIEKQPVTNPLMALQGRVPGLDITPRSGTPGIAPTIRIRGTNSLRNNNVSLQDNGNYPLYIVDGVPVNSTPISSVGGSYTSGGYDPLSTISPSAIESIEILKDGDATAIYGSRGANGVILITTKNNSKGNEKTSVDITYYTGAGRVSKQMEVLDTKQYIGVRKEAFKNDGLSPDPTFDFDLTVWDTTRYTNWQKVLLGGTAKINDFQASISSGSKNTSFRFAGGFHKETLVFPGDYGYQRGSAQMSITHRSHNGRLTFVTSINYGIENNNVFNDSGTLLNSALSLPPNAPALYNAGGGINWDQRVINGITRSTWTNPISFLVNKQKTNTNNIVSSANIDYKLFKDLSASLALGYTNLNSAEKGQRPLNGLPPGTANVTGTASFLDNKRMSWILEPKLSYRHRAKNYSFTALAGGTLQQSLTSTNFTVGDKYSSDALLGSIKGAGVVTTYTDDAIEYKFMSIYSRIGYEFKNKYLVNITGRRDGSSRFGPGNRFGNFGAIGVGWIFSNEPLIQGISSILNFGKIRSSFGVTGSDQIGDYQYYNLYDISTYKYNDGSIGFLPAGLPNSNYRWELTKKFEAALEMGFIENRLGLEVGYYRNRSSNQLVNYTLPVVTGFSSVLENFPATIQNTGWEVTIKGDVLNSNSWRWNMSFNVSLPNNMLIRFDDIENSPYATIYEVGRPLSLKLLYTYKGINQETGLYEFEDRNNDEQIDNADKILQNPNDRAFYGGLNNTIQYGPFDISILFQFSKQASTRYYPTYSPGRMMNQPIDVLDHWRYAGDPASSQKFSTSATAYQNYINLTLSNYNYVDAAFIRLKTISIGYRLSQQWLKDVGLQEIRVFGQGQNIFTITDYPGLDPETANTLPPLRMLTLGLQAKF